MGAMAFKSYFFINKVGEKRPTAPWRTTSTKKGTVLPAPVSDPALWTDTDRYAEGGVRQFPNDLEMRCEVTANWLRLRQEEKIWTTGLPGEGVVLKQAKGHYICCPRDLQHDKSKFYEMAAKLNVRVSAYISVPPEYSLLISTGSYVDHHESHQSYPGGYQDTIC
jgi:hypothetical protein